MTAFSSTNLPRIGQRVRTVAEPRLLADVLAVHEKGIRATIYRIDGNGPDVCTMAPDCFESVRGKPFVAGVDDRRRDGTNPGATAAPAASDDAAIDEITDAVRRALAGRTSATVDLAPFRSEVDAVRDELNTLETSTTTVFTDLAERLDASELRLADRVDANDEKIRLLAEALAVVPAATRARAALAVSLAGGKEPLLAAIAPFYTAGQDTAANVMLCSPPSLGKSFSVRKLGAGYDVYLEHGASDDPDEIVTIIGGPTPDNENGGFANPDGVLVEAVRLAAAGQNVLLLIDEVLRFSPRAQEWLLTFLTGVKTPAGRVYRLRTRKLKDGAFEVLECPTKHLHIIGATNLGVIAPVEAFWSRWFKVRVEFSQDIVAEVATAVCASYGITDADALVKGYVQVVTQSRAAVANGTLRFPADIRLLETACKAAPAATGAAVGVFIAEHLTDQTAHWNIDTGDVLAESAAACASWVSLLKSL